MPCLHYFAVIITDNFPYDIEFFCCKTLIFAQHNRLQPEFTNHSFSLDMYVHRLVAVKAIKEKPILSRNILNRRHIDNISDISKQFIRKQLTDLKLPLSIPFPNQNRSQVIPNACNSPHPLPHIKIYSK